MAKIEGNVENLALLKAVSEARPAAPHGFIEGKKKYPKIWCPRCRLWKTHKLMHNFDRHGKAVRMAHCKQCRKIDRRKCDELGITLYTRHQGAVTTPKGSRTKT